MAICLKPKTLPLLWGLFILENLLKLAPTLITTHLTFLVGYFGCFSVLFQLFVKRRLKDKFPRRIFFLCVIANGCTLLSMMIFHICLILKVRPIFQIVIMLNEYLFLILSILCGFSLCWTITNGEMKAPPTPLNSGTIVFSDSKTLLLQRKESFEALDEETLHRSPPTQEPPHIIFVGVPPLTRSENLSLNSTSGIPGDSTSSIA